MLKVNITKIVPIETLAKLANYMSHFYPVHKERILKLILQVNSVDVALELLGYHSKSDLTLDRIIMDYLTHRDNLQGSDKRAFDKQFNRGRYEQWFAQKMEGV